MKVKEYYDRLLKGVEELLQGEVGEFLSFMKNFKRYSFANTLLIWCQRPDATRVAGMKTWNSLGRKVKKGEKGIAIFAPLFRKIKKEEMEDNGSEAVEITENDIGITSSETSPEKGNIQLTGFKAVYVFDVSQTEGEPLPEEPERGDIVVTGDPAELFKRIFAVSPVPVSYEENIKALGYYSLKEHRIVLSVSLSEAEKPLVLLHELAHYLACKAQEHTINLHDRPKAEVIAEGAAYIVSAHYGLDTSGYSFSYVARWAKEPQKVLVWGNAVQRVASRLMEMIEKAGHENISNAAYQEAYG